MTNNKSFTLIELVVAIVVIAILAMLLLPVIARTGWQTKKMSCVSNLRQIGLALLLYADDNDDALPPLLANPEYAKYSGSGVVGRFDPPDIYPQYIDDYRVFHDPSWHDEPAFDESWPKYNKYSFYWTGNSTQIYDSDGSVIPPSIKGGTYVLVFCGSYHACHGHKVFGNYTSYTGKNILWSDGSIAYVYANITETQGKTPRATFNKPEGSNVPRNWR